MPSRLLGPDEGTLAPIELPASVSPAVVAAHPAPAARPTRKPRLRRVARPKPQLASVVVHRQAPTRRATRAHRAATRKHVGSRAAVAAAMRTARVTVLNRVRRHPLPPDEARPAAPAPAPAPTPAPAPAPGPAPAAVPAATAPAPAPAPALPAPTPPVRIFADRVAPAAPVVEAVAPAVDEDTHDHGNGPSRGHGHDGEQRGHAWGHHK